MTIRDAIAKFEWINYRALFYKSFSMKVLVLWEQNKFNCSFTADVRCWHLCSKTSVSV